MCGYKNYPELWRFADGKPKEINLDEYITKDTMETEDKSYYGVLDGYEFNAEQYDGNMIDLLLREPDGTEWTGTCGYCYGAGHMDLG